MTNSVDDAPVAQWIEHGISNPRVAGSNPAGRTGDVIMPSNEYTMKAVRKAEMIFDKVMKAKYHNHVDDSIDSQDIKDMIKLTNPPTRMHEYENGRRLGDDMGIYHMSAKIARLTERTKKFNEQVNDQISGIIVPQTPQTTPVPEVDAATIEAWKTLAGISPTLARKQMQDVIGRVGKKEALRRMQAVGEATQWGALTRSQPTTFSDEEIVEWAKNNRITTIEMRARIEAARKAGTLDYLRPWNASPIYAPYMPLKPTPPQNVRVNVGVVTRNEYENKKRAAAIRGANELMYQEHVKVDGLQFANLAWVKVTIQPLWFPVASIKNVLASFDEQIEYVHSHITGHWWSGYTITGYFYDRPSADKAAQDLKKKVCWDGYIESQRPRPSLGPPPPKGRGGPPPKPLAPPMYMLQ